MLPKERGVEVISYFEAKEQQSKTYLIDRENKRITVRITDYLKAVEQAVYLILSIERYDYVMFSWNYGVELKDLFGQVKEVVIPNLINRIKEALLQDDRIIDVTNFKYRIEFGKYYISFTVVSKYGNIGIDEVMFNV